MEKKITLDERFGKEFAGAYVFRSISWGRSNQITSDCTSVNPAIKTSRIDLKRLQGLMLNESMKERPKIITLDMLLSEDPEKGIPMVLGEILMSCADFVNGYTEKDRAELKNLKKQWGLG
jgi:hypothetical protein